MRHVWIAGLVLAGSAHAVDGPYISPTNERVRITLGARQTSDTTNLRVDSTAAIAGTPVSGENDFGLDDKKVTPQFQALIRAGQRHRLRFDYFQLDRSGDVVLDQPILFRNAVLAPGDQVRSNLSLRTFGIAYGYSIIHGEKFELAPTLSVNMLDFSARARVQEPARRIDQREDVAGPFPTIGLDASWIISKRFYLDGRFQYLKASVDDFDGSFTLFEVSALYRWRANLAIGAGYFSQKARITSTQSDESGFFNIKSTAPELFMRVAF